MELKERLIEELLEKKEELSKIIGGRPCTASCSGKWIGCGPGYCSGPCPANCISNCMAVPQ